MPEKFSSSCLICQISPGDIVFCFIYHLNQNLNHKETSVPYNWSHPHLCLEALFYSVEIFGRPVGRILYREGQTPSAFCISHLCVQSLVFCILHFDPKHGGWRQSYLKRQQFLNMAQKT